MARRLDKEKAIKMRLKGASYSQIKEKLGVPKGTLSVWLRDYPLSRDRIRKLRDVNPKRIESYRNTMRLKREAEFDKYLDKVSKDIGKLDKRDLFIAGLFLYWAEGGKTTRYRVSLSNTDPSMLKFFIKWLIHLGVKKSDLKVHIHVYVDMNPEKQIDFWSKKLGISKKQFRKPYVKKSKLSELTYKKGFGQGTCNVIYDNKEIAYYTHMGLRYLNEYYS